MEDLFLSICILVACLSCFYLGKYYAETLNTNDGDSFEGFPIETTTGQPRQDNDYYDYDYQHHSAYTPVYKKSIYYEAEIKDELPKYYGSCNWWNK